MTANGPSNLRCHDSKASLVAELVLQAGICGWGAALGSKWVKAQITFIYKLMCRVESQICSINFSIHSRSS